MKAVALTDRGKVRMNNEDTVFCSTNPVGNLPNLFVVADGMGGAKAGDYASSSVISELVRLISADKKNKTHNEIMRHAIDNANMKLYMDSCSNPDYSGCGTTLVTAVIDDGVLYVSNIGDSRLYIINNHHIEQITRDHSYVEEMVQLGRMKRGSKDYKEKKNIITRAIGVEKTVKIDFFEFDTDPTDKVLLCSDGLSNMIDDKQIFKLVNKAADIEGAAKALIAAANDNGGRDNISAVLIGDFGKEANV